MKRLIVVAFVLSLGVFTSCGDTKKEEKQEVVGEKKKVASVYQCPMQCEGESKTYAEPGSCPVCKMDLKAVVVDE